PPSNQKEAPGLGYTEQSPHVPTPNLEDQETVFVRPLTIDQPGIGDSCRGTLSSIAQWIAEVRKPSHHGKVQSLRDGESLRSDREVWWTQKVKEMEEAQKAGNARRLFQLIRATGPRKPPVSESIKHQNGTTISNKEERLDRLSCNLRVAWHLGTEKVLQLNDTSNYITRSRPSLIKNY
ncbi:LOW QUALITY PROTEIN: hypothetical protein T265_13493, partial [Opisthorchis viverrini]